MKFFFIFLFFILPVFSIYAGEITLQFEKSWVISANETITDVALNGSFILENDFQQVLQKNVTDGAEFQIIDNRTYVIFKSPEFSGIKTITATAMIHANYPIGIRDNPFFVPGRRNTTNLTRFDADISSIAESLSSDKKTELEVLSSLTDWTYRFIEYNLSYKDLPSPAIEVYHNPNAVCVGYTHLLISLLNSLGFETHFVSGYAFADEWQAHAWAEAKVGEKWIPLDPTFRETLTLDARHIATSYSDDQSGAFDVLTARGKGFRFNSTVSIKTLDKQQFEEFLFVHPVLYDDELKIILYNPTEYYVTPTYELLLPDYLLSPDSQILVIAPEESETRMYHLNTGKLEAGYAHTIPYYVDMQGTNINGELTLVKGTLREASPTQYYEPPEVKTETCPLIGLALVLILFSFRHTSLAYLHPDSSE